MGIRGGKKAKRQTPLFKSRFEIEFIYSTATGICKSLLLSFGFVAFLFFSIKETKQKEEKKNEKKDKFSGVLHQKRVKGMFNGIIQIKP